MKASLWNKVSALCAVVLYVAWYVRASPALRVKIVETTASAPIPSTFASFSFEQGHVAPLRDTKGDPCKIYLQLLANLAHASNISINESRVIRIGGNSQDSTCYEYSAGTQGCTGNLTRSDLEKVINIPEYTASEKAQMRALSSTHTPCW